jgi:outer membrane biosynthesis protein TonB
MVGIEDAPRRSGLFSSAVDLYDATMAKPVDTTRVLRSVVSPALGLSVVVLAAAASAGCGNSGASGPGITSESPATSAATTSVAAATTSAAPTATAVAADPSAAPQPSATASATSTSSVASPSTTQPIRPPGVTARPIPKPGPPPTPIPPVGTTATQRIPTPGPPPHPKVGVMIAPDDRPAPGFAPSRAAFVPSEERPTRATRRATDTDRGLSRGRLSRRLV